MELSSRLSGVSRDVAFLDSREGSFSPELVLSTPAP